MKMYNEVKTITKLPDNREIEISTGKLAKQATGSVVVRMGKTMLLATVTASKQPKEGVDFLPLSVDYREKYSAVGRFPGGFLKREGKPSNHEVLVSRLIDRAIRPLFPDNFRYEIFVNVFLISVDKNDMPDALAGLAASAAITVSDLPFNGPMSEVRVSRINGEVVVNPQADQNEEANIDLIVAATQDNIMMVEGEMKEVQEAEMLELIKAAHDTVKNQCAAQKELEKLAGKGKKRELEEPESDDRLYKVLYDETYQKCYDIANKGIADKHKRAEMFDEILDAFMERYEDTDEEDIPIDLIKKYYHDIQKDAVRQVVLDNGVRLDGRKTDEIRPIWCEVDTLPSAHGSAIFTRGETQSLTTVTLGTKLDEQLIDDVMYKGYEEFILHYNFPPFSTGDARPVRFTSRREIGHGNLAYRALLPVIPEKNADFPYTLRIVSDILESNGSSSMATVCAGTLSLMDAGVKISKPVSGIAMGMISDEKSGKYAILSDILGDEDHLGDMDFKVTGTRDGITATQMDIKVEGLSYEVLAKALEQAKQGRLHILDKIEETIPAPREEYKEHAPHIVSINIPQDMIGSVIGPGGKIIQELQLDTDSIITIEEEDNQGRVEVFADNKEKIDKALDRIKAIIAVPEVGEVYEGTVKTLASYGAFVEILPGKDGLLHISEFDWKHIKSVEDVLSEGDKIKVKVIGIDDRSGKIKLSRKALLEKPEGYVEKKPQGDRRGGPRDKRRDDKPYRKPGKRY
ncbi:MAG: polyribonucleotide nucleotidyltransferase [Bacteroidota bacterium]|nr:polyribonucleotide nucleotidyltransferase [Bacteroidota bacterium]